MPRVFAALLLPHDVCDTLARDAKAFARYDRLARFTPSTLLPHDVCDTLARDAKAFARYDRLARFTPSTNLHLTLAFVGDVTTDEAYRLSAAIRPLATLTPRDITIARVGTFDRHRILYAGLTPAESLDPVYRLSAAIRPLATLTPRDITIARVGTFDRHRILYAGLTPAESLDPVVNEVRNTITRLGLPMDRKPFRAHITIARDWRRGHPPMTLPTRTVHLSGPVLMESVKDPRTGMIRYRQVI